MNGFPPNEHSCPVARARRDGVYGTCSISGFLFYFFIGKRADKKVCGGWGKWGKASGVPLCRVPPRGGVYSYARVRGARQNGADGVFPHFPQPDLKLARRKQLLLSHYPNTGSTDSTTKLQNGSLSLLISLIISSCPLSSGVSLTNLNR